VVLFIFDFVMMNQKVNESINASIKCPRMHPSSIEGFKNGRNGPQKQLKGKLILSQSLWTSENPPEYLTQPGGPLVQ
jgi:hypothetical protein